MDGSKKIEKRCKIRNVLSGVCLLIMLITLIFQIAKVLPVAIALMLSIVAIEVVMIIMDLKSRDRRDFKSDIINCIIWSLNFIINVCIVCFK